MIFILSVSFFLLNYSGRKTNSPHKEALDLNHLLKHVVGDLQACSAIIQGDMFGVDKDVFRKLLASKKEKLCAPSLSTSTQKKDCPSYIRDRGFLMVSLSKEEKDFPIAYSIVIHEKIEMFERLLRAIYNKKNKQ